MVGVRSVHLPRHLQDVKSKLGLQVLRGPVFIGHRVSMTPPKLGVADRRDPINGGVAVAVGCIVG
jgi:hypothetical protein